MSKLYDAKKLRAYPNNDQKNRLQELFGSHRFVYNYFLGLSKDIYEITKNKDETTELSIDGFCQKLRALADAAKDQPIRHWTEDAVIVDTVIEKLFKNGELQKKSLSKFDNMRVLTVLKNTDHYKWLGVYHLNFLRSAIVSLHTAYDKFYDGGGYPKFKSKRTSKKAIATDGVDNKNIDCTNGWLIIPQPREKSGRWVNPKLRVKFDGRFPLPDTDKVKQFTISNPVADEYYVSIMVEKGSNNPIPQSVDLSTAIGIDLGIKTLATLSDGTSYNLSKGYDVIDKKIKKIQKQLSRKIGNKKHETRSNNYIKLQAKLNKLYKHKANKLKDDLHKITTKIVKEPKYNTICVESLTVAGMIVSGKKSKLSKSISMQGWAKFITMLDYKSKKMGKNFLKVGTYYGSSQTCSKCGNIKPDMKDLSKRVFECPDCGNVLDRDINASINIRNQAVDDFIRGVDNTKIRKTRLKLPNTPLKKKRVKKIKSSSNNVKKTIIKEPSQICLMHIPKKS